MYIFKILEKENTKFAGKCGVTEQYWVFFEVCGYQETTVTLIQRPFLSICKWEGKLGLPLYNSTGREEMWVSGSQQGSHAMF